jgi:hypothetical protein
MSLLSATALIATETAASFLSSGLGIARVLGLAVTSWRVDDPTRVTFHYLAEALATLEGPKVTFIKAGWLSTAVADAEETGDSRWLKVHADEVYGVEAEEETYATPSIVFTNTGGGYYPDLTAGEVTVKIAASGKTYHNSETFTIESGPGAVTDAIAFVADEGGSDSTCAADEIDELVTTLLGVEITSNTAAVAADEASPAAIAEQCGATLGALSPNGPADAYEYVARDASLTGVDDVARARTVDDSDTGDVTLYVFGSGGAVAGASITAVEDAIELWATPCCITPTVEDATGVTVAVTATVAGVDIPDGFEDTIEDALLELFGAFPIADAAGETLPLSEIIASIRNTLVDAGASGVIVTLTVPAANVALAEGEVPVLGTVTITEV